MNTSLLNAVLAQQIKIWTEQASKVTPRIMAQFLYCEHNELTQVLECSRNQLAYWQALRPGNIVSELATRRLQNP